MQLSVILCWFLIVLVPMFNQAMLSMLYRMCLIGFVQLLGIPYLHLQINFCVLNPCVVNPSILYITSDVCFRLEPLCGKAKYSIYKIKCSI